MPIRCRDALVRLVFVIIRWNIGNVATNSVLSHATVLAVEEHVIYLLLVSYFKIFLPLDEVGLALLEVKL